MKSLECNPIHWHDDRNFIHPFIQILWLYCFYGLVPLEKDFQKYTMNYSECLFHLYLCIGPVFAHMCFILAGLLNLD